MSVGGTDRGGDAFGGTEDKHMWSIIQFYSVGLSQSRIESFVFFIHIVYYTIKGRVG